MGAGRGRQQREHTGAAVPGTLVERDGRFIEPRLRFLDLGLDALDLALHHLDLGGDTRDLRLSYLDLLCGIGSLAVERDDLRFELLAPRRCTLELRDRRDFRGGRALDRVRKLVATRRRLGRRLAAGSRGSEKAKQK